MATMNRRSALGLLFLVGLAVAAPVSVRLAERRALAASSFTPGTYSADKRALVWLPNGDTQLVVGVSTAAGSERSRAVFTFTAAGRVISSNGSDIGAVPAGWAAALAAVGTRMDTAVATLCGASRCDP